MFFHSKTQDLWYGSAQGVDRLAQRVDPFIRSEVQAFFASRLNWTGNGPLSIVDGYIESDYGPVWPMDHIEAGTIAGGLTLDETRYVQVSSDYIAVRPIIETERLSEWTGIQRGIFRSAMVRGNTVWFTGKSRDINGQFQVEIFSMNVEDGKSKKVQSWTPDTMIFDPQLTGDPWYVVRKDLPDPWYVVRGGLPRPTEIWHEKKKIIEFQQTNRYWNVKLVDAAGRVWLKHQSNGSIGAISQQGRMNCCILRNTEPTAADFKSWICHMLTNVTNMTVSPCTNFLFCQVYDGRVRMLAFAIRENEGRVWLEEREGHTPSSGFAGHVFTSF